MSEIKTGTVKWFNASKGYGFITPSEDDKDSVSYTHLTLPTNREV